MSIVCCPDEAPRKPRKPTHEEKLRALKLLRPAEKLVTKLPLGAQYLNLCQKPSSKGADSSRLVTNHG